MFSVYCSLTMPWSISVIFTINSYALDWMVFPQSRFAKPTHPCRPCKTREQNFKCTWPAFVGTCVLFFKKLLCCTRSSLKYYFSTGSCASEFSWTTSGLFLWAAAEHNWWRGRCTVHHDLVCGSGVNRRRFDARGILCGWLAAYPKL